MKTLTTFSLAVLLICLLSLMSCSSRQPATTASNSNQANFNVPKALVHPSPEVKPSINEEAVTPKWIEGVKYYYLTVGDKTYHGTKASERELRTCVGRKIPIESGKLIPTQTPCSNYDLKGRKVSEDEEREAELENEACPDGSDDAADSGEPGIGDVIDLAEAVREEMVEAEPEGHGEGLRYMKLSLSLNINTAIYVRIPPGTIFLPGDGRSTNRSSTQRMITTAPAIKRLEVPGEEICVSIPVACLDIELKVPQPGQPFSVGSISSLERSSEVGKLVNSSEFLREGWIIKQGALWIVRSNPGKDHPYFSGMPDEYFKRIRTLLQQARIPTDRFEVFSGLD